MPIATETTQTQQKCQPWGLKKHEDAILQLRLEGLTLQEIADKFGTTRESVRNVVARRLLNLKRGQAA